MLIKDEDTEGLSPEEREALMAEDDEADALKAIADEDEIDGEKGGEDGEKGGEDGEKGGEDGEKVVDKAADKPADKAAAEKDGEKDDAKAADDKDGAKAAEDDAGDGESPAARQEEDAAFVPRFEAALPEDYEERLRAVEEAEAEADAKFEADETTHAEYRKAMREIAAQREELREMKLRADLAEDYSRQIGRQHWHWESDRFMEDMKEREGIDYKGDPKLYGMLNTAVKLVGSSEEAKDMTARQILAEAHTWVKARNGIAPLADAGGKDPKDGKPKDGKPPARKPDLKSVPKTLGDLPAAGANETGDDEFAELDKLDGMELERALAKMPADKQDRYLRAGG